MKTDFRTIGNNIKVLREKLNYTQSQLADFLGIRERVTISYYETGERSIPLEHLTKIADLFGIELETLLTNDPEVLLTNKFFAFRKDRLNQEDYITLASFHRIVKNYRKLKSLEERNGIQS
ncbi:MAG: helix-turn-helix transcriptional regulator [Melioribacteraceae bacterium]